MRIIQQTTSPLSVTSVTFVRSIATGLGVVVIRWQQQKDSEISAAPEMTSDNPIPSSMQLCYSPKKLRKFQENKLKCLGINLTGLTVMPVHDPKNLLQCNNASMNKTPCV